MSQYGTPKHVRKMVDEREPLERNLVMAEEHWQRCEGARTGKWSSPE